MIGSFIVLLLIFVLVTGVFGWFFILKSRAKDQSKGTFEKMYAKEED